MTTAHRGPGRTRCCPRSPGPVGSCQRSPGWIRSCRRSPAWLPEGAAALPAALAALFLALAAGLLPLAAAAQEPSQPAPPAAQRPDLPPLPPLDPSLPGPEAGAGRPSDDPRSVVLLRRNCESSLDREEVTLFANGTVRVLQGPPGEEEMDLGELDPDQLRTYADRIRAEDLGETDRRTSGPVGDWVSRCRLELHFDAMERWVGSPPVAPHDGSDGRRSRGDAVFEYGTYGSLSLGLSRVLALVDGISGGVDRAVGRGLLPDDYRPRRGDVLRRADGVLFRVERTTASKDGWELQGVQQPLTLYILKSEIPKLFVELVERR